MHHNVDRSYNGSDDGKGPRDASDGGPDDSDNEGNISVAAYSDYDGDISDDFYDDLDDNGFGTSKNDIYHNLHGKTITSQVFTAGSRSSLEVGMRP